MQYISALFTTRSDTQGANPQSPKVLAPEVNQPVVSSCMEMLQAYVPDMESLKERFSGVVSHLVPSTIYGGDKVNTKEAEEVVSLTKTEQQASTDLGVKTALTSVANSVKGVVQRFTNYWFGASKEQPAIDYSRIDEFSDEEETYSVRTKRKTTPLPGKVVDVRKRELEKRLVAMERAAPIVHSFARMVAPRIKHLRAQELAAKHRGVTKIQSQFKRLLATRKVDSVRANAKSTAEFQKAFISGFMALRLNAIKSKREEQQKMETMARSFLADPQNRVLVRLQGHVKAFQNFVSKFTF
ncbi:MAG: hypothetical protein P0S95_02665 [Rhabdochlamydiaceae bacterium]|nr:hypothetical protein [Candidatus Amphrikana amoebophyrae]